jgi:anaerobic magnesium-protoporphyrin IX monomethyl ester cyclase
MKVLIVYPDINTIQFPHYQHGIAWISAVLKRAGHAVELLYLDREWADDELVAEVRRRDPDVIAFSSTTQQFLFTRRYAAALRGLGKFIVIGGIHATVDPERVIETGLFDALVRGEGEYPLLELLDALAAGRDYRGIANLWSRSPEGALIKNPVRPPLDVATLPWPDRELFDEELLLMHNAGQVSVMASRGCPFRCTYCCNTVLSDLVGGNRNWVRQRPPEDVLAEIADLHRRFPAMKSLIFMDEVFTTKKKWVREFCAAYKARFTTPFQVFLRIESVDREMMEWMKDAGLYSIIVGVESGNERIRREVLNRHMTNEQIIRVFRWADELGLETWDFNMIGVPGDTEATIRDTMELNRVIRPHHLQISIFYPFPGTPLYERCVAEGLAKVDESTSVFHSKPVLDLPGLPRELVEKLHKEFVALGHRIEAEKSAEGYADLAALFKDARITAGGPEYVGLWRVRIGGQDRMAILMHPPSSAAYRLTITPGTVLRFGMGFSADVWDKPGGGATFSVKIKTRMRSERVVFSELIDPKHNPAHRAWQDREVDLSLYAGKTVELTLATSTPPGDNQFCPAFWSRPHLITR